MKKLERGKRRRENGRRTSLCGERRPLPVAGGVGAQAGFYLPRPLFFEELRKAFCAFMRSIFLNFHFLPEETIRKGMKEILGKYKIPNISINEVYSRSLYALRMGRRVDGGGLRSCVGPRPGESSVAEQAHRLHRRFKKMGLREKRVVLVDDILFGGESEQFAIQVLEAFGRKVVKMVAGVAVGHGIQAMKKAGVSVEAAFTFPEVLDELCERDFYVGAPFSGLPLIGEKDNTAMPYMLPWGRPHTLASIPRKLELAFSRFCISQSVALWEMVEESAGFPVRCENLPKGVPGFPARQRVAVALRDVLARLGK